MDQHSSTGSSSPQLEKDTQSQSFTENSQSPPLVKLNIKVNGRNETEVSFKIKNTTPLGKLMNVYCDKQGIKRGSQRFIFDGKRVQPNDTAHSLDMIEGDSIDCLPEQTGGICSWDF